jgi:pyruvate/oxaloacetate carboxyltransferase
MGSKVYIKNHYDNKEEMYSLVDAVYSNSKFETYGLVEAECTLNHIPFGGISNKPEILTNEEILERWKTILE